ncbi:MAG TPA: hypothetical protein VMP01_14515 [Pirellulaceae bacterium]|nr:hypothetical protein [Pirellulaceae bacterium]
MWRPFDNGATIGQHGSEGGVVIRDEEHDAGARIALERGCSYGVPFAVTCGIYGWFFHTRRLDSEPVAEWPAMLDGLAAILDIIPHADDPAADAKMGKVCDAIQAFVLRFP